MDQNALRVFAVASLVCVFQIVQLPSHRAQSATRATQKRDRERSDSVRSDQRNDPQTFGNACRSREQSPQHNDDLVAHMLRNDDDCNNNGMNVPELEVT